MRRIAVVPFVLSVAGWLLLVGAEQPRGQAAPSPDAFTDHASSRVQVFTAMRDLIASAFDLPNGPVAHDAGAATVKAMIRDRVEPRLLAGALSFEGQDYFFTPSDGLNRHISLWRIRYRRDAAARTAAAAVARQRFFRRGKILTPMATARRGDEVLVVFTEHARDTRLLALLDAAADALGGDR